MNFLIVGSTILAGQSAAFVQDADNVYSGGVSYSKNAMTGYAIVTGTLPAGASVGDCEYVGGQVVRKAPPVPPQADNAGIIKDSYNASLKREAAKLAEQGNTFEAVQLLLKAQGVQP